MTFRSPSLPCVCIGLLLAFMMDRIVRNKPGKDSSSSGKCSSDVYRSVSQSATQTTGEPTTASVMHFFQKEYTYTCHGEQAVVIAKQFYRTSNVIKYEQGLETLEVGTKLFATILRKILADRLNVCIWRKEGNDWVIWKSGSPSNVAQLEDLIPNSTGSNVGAVVGAHFATVCVQLRDGKDKTSPVVLGVVLVSTSQLRMTLFDNLDGMDLSLLETLLAQYEAAECIIKCADVEVRSHICSMLERNNIAWLRSAEASSSSIAQDAADLRLDVLNELKDLSCPVAQDVDADVHAQLSGLQSCTMEAAQMALQHLKLWRNPACRKSYDISIGNAELIMEYDSSVAAALSLFSHTTGEELESASSGNTLFGLLNQTNTLPGGRLLKQWLLRPLRDVAVILARQQCVKELVNLPQRLEALRQSKEHLLRFPDLEKLVQKLLRAESSVSLSDLLTVYRCVVRTSAIAQLLASQESSLGSPTPLQQMVAKLELAGTKCAKYLALVEEVVDLQRINETYGSKNHNSSGADDVGTTEEYQNYLGSHSSGRVFHDKWVRVRPDFSPTLQVLYQDILVLQSNMQAEHARVVELCKSLEPSTSKATKRATSSSTAASSSPADSKVVMLESTSVHGPHLRATKRLAPAVLKILNSGAPSSSKGSGSLFLAKGASVASEVTVLSQQKAGTLFVTSEMKALSARFLRAKEAYQACQAEVVGRAVAIAVTYVPVLRTIARLIAEIDCYGALAHVALYNDWTMPTMTPTIVTSDTNTNTVAPSGASSSSSASASGTSGLSIVQVRHPMLEAQLGTQYVASDLRLDSAQKMCIITGPNMGGKSTFMRAVGICVTLAHIGSFVPAKEASISVMDKIFMRIGATDCAELGVSTFMAEMLEVSRILKHATSNSLVLIDELGRGTSTDDGFGIASAVLQTLLEENRSTVLCATHFHELTTYFDSPQRNAAVLDQSVMSVQIDQPLSVKEEVRGRVVNLHASAHIDAHNRRITMLYEILPGPAWHSYGIHVAQMANFPQEIVSEAANIEVNMLRTCEQRQLEDGDVHQMKRRKVV